MPTVPQLEARLARLEKQLASAPPSGDEDAAPSRQLRKRRRRLQRKLRLKQGVKAAKAAKPEAAAPPPAPPAEA
jgi:hypothetical protein